MNQYIITPNANDYDGLLCVHPEGGKILSHFLGTRPWDGMPEQWTPLEVKIDKARKSGDFLCLSGQIILTEKAWQILAPLCGENAEVLPLVGDGVRYLALKVKFADCLDYSRAKVRRYDSSGRVKAIDHYAFKDGCLDGINVFRLPERRSYVLASQLFKDCVEANNLEGLRFSQVA